MILSPNECCQHGLLGEVELSAVEPQCPRLLLIVVENFWDSNITKLDNIIEKSKGRRLYSHGSKFSKGNSGLTPNSKDTAPCD
jgi:hypothetical protein